MVCTRTTQIPSICFALGLLLTLIMNCMLVYLIYGTITCVCCGIGCLVVVVLLTRRYLLATAMLIKFAKVAAEHHGTFNMGHDMGGTSDNL